MNNWEVKELLPEEDRYNDDLYTQTSAYDTPFSPSANTNRYSKY